MVSYSYGNEAFMATMIRPYQAHSNTDITAITEIYAYHVTHGRGSFEHEAPSLEEMQARFSALLDKDYPILVAEQDGAIVGYAYAGPHKARKGYNGTVEDSVYIAPSHARKGIGRQLLMTLIAQAKADGYRQMMAVIGDSANTASIGLHKDVGFTMIGTAKGIGYKFGTYLDVTYMQYALQDDAL